ncbi:MAG: four-carbon acid sugar kinase family protein [Fusobacteriota bacterium]
MNLVILSDDFTGSNDIGINLKQYGLNIFSVIDNIPEISDVNIISSETRNSTPKVSYEKVNKIFGEIKKNGFDKFYKKVDSTLRGNIKSEIDAIVENKNDDEIISVIIGFPKMGRKIINGVHYLNGKRLKDTEFANDPANPVIEDDLKEIFPEALVIKKSDIRRGMAEKIKGLENKIIIFDSETQEDLNKIAETLVKLNQDKYIIGSAGIMEYLPKYWGMNKRKTIIISGSCSETNIKQVDNFLNKKKEKFNILKLDVFNKNDDLKESINDNKDIFIKTLDNKKEPQSILRKYNETGTSNREATSIISDYIAQKSVELIKKYDIRNIIMTGGEISYKILKRLDIKGLNLQEKIQTGIPLGKSLDFKYNIITKPGAFGDKKVYFSAYEKLKFVDK